LKKNPKYSKRINYDALADIFKSAPGGGFDEDEKEDEELYTFDDKSEGETLVEEGNTRPTIGMDFGGVGESDKGEDYITGWDDTFEQEV
jgi:transcription factor IIIB subunit 2